MASVAPPVSALPPEWNLADLHAHLGRVPLARIRLHPAPGTATEQDAIRIHDREGRYCELIDGTLVEKTVGWYESLLAVIIGQLLNNYLDEHPLGMALGADGALKIFPDMIRIPDVSFIRRERLPKHKLPRRPIPALIPNLAVEVLSPSNTKGEMRRKLKDYFASGVELVWFIDPAQRSAMVYTAPGNATRVDETGELDGGTVLPGFRLSLRDLFARADRQTPGSEESD